MLPSHWMERRIRFTRSPRLIQRCVGKPFIVVTVVIFSPWESSGRNLPLPRWENYRPRSATPCGRRRFDLLNEWKSRNQNEIKANSGSMPVMQACSSWEESLHLLGEQERCDNPADPSNIG